ncbi:MAG: trigger factor [Candidatus Goldiibacteriota bacterium]
MKFEVKDNGGCKKEIEVILEKEDVGKSLEKVMEGIVKNAQVDGYRKGKVPEDIIKTRYRDTISEETIKDAVQAAYPDVIKQSELNIASYPALSDVKFTDDKNEEISFKIEVETHPEFEVADYKKMGIETKKLKEIKQEDVEKEIEKLRQYRGNLVTAEKDEVEKGDYVEASIVGFVDGKAESELTTDNQVSQVGAGNLIKGLDEALAGMKAGEEKDVETEFPEDYFNKKYAGKKALFKVKIKAVKKLELPELNDEFAKSNGGHESVEALKKTIESELKKQAEADIRSHNAGEVIKKLIENNKFDVPSAFVEQELNNIMTRYENTMKQQGLSMDRLGMDKNELREKQRQTAEDNVKIMYILRKVADKEGIELSDEDVETEIKKIAGEMKQDADALIKQSKAQGNWDALKAKLQEDKVMEKLIEYNV